MNPNIKIWVDTYGSVFKKYTRQGFLMKVNLPIHYWGIGEDIVENVDFDLIDHFEKVE